MNKSTPWRNSSYRVTFDRTAAAGRYATFFVNLTA